MGRTALVASIFLASGIAQAQSTLTIASVPSQPATVDAAYSQTFTASGGVPPYKWRVISGVLPSGLSLNAASGVLFGMPDTAGVSQFAVRVLDSAGTVESVLVSLQVQPAPLAVTTQSPLPRGIVGVDYPQLILAANGGTGTYTFSAPATTLPPGITLDNGVLEGTPTAAGAYAIPVTVTDQAGATATSTLAMTIRASAVDLVLGRSALSLKLGVNAAAVPTARHISVQSSAVSQTLSYTAVVNPFVPWLTVTAGGATPDTLLIGLNAQALQLIPGDYPATVVVDCTSAVCNGKNQQISVDLTVTAPPPRLKVVTDILSYLSTPDMPIPAAQAVSIENAGSSTLGISAISCAAAWCSVGAVPADVSAGAPVMVNVSVNPAGMSPGYYRTTLTVVSSAQTASIPVTLRIAKGAFRLAPAGAQFRMIAGAAPGNPAGSFGLSVSGVSPIAWTATVLPGASWLLLGSTSGTVTPGTPATIPFSIDPAAAALLAPQTWYGTIRIAGSGVVNSPRDFRVILTVAPPGSPVRPEIAPAGLVFVTSAGTSPPPQPIQVFAGSKGAVAFSVTAKTYSGGAWLSVSSMSSQSSASKPASASVSVNAAGLSQGVYRGGVTFAFSAAAVRTASVTLIVRPGGSISMLSSEPRATMACMPTALVATQTGLVDNFSAPASWPVPLEIRLADDCGNPVSNGQVVATFSSADPPLAMSLVDSTTATYSATWMPQRSASQVDITTLASAPGLASSTVVISGNVLPNAAPSLTPNSVLHVFNPEVGDPLAPGTIVQIYGSHLASQPASASSIPLEDSLGNVSVVVGGIEAPLYYVSPGQINAQIPFELDPNGEFDVVISANGALTTPQSIEMAPATPGLCVYGDGSIIGQHQDGTLITKASPAVPGEVATMYLAGMGPTDVPVVSGSASPGVPFAHPTAAPTLTIGGNSVPMTFDGLTPSLVGLYQIDFQIPMNAKGNLEMDVTQNGITANSTILRVSQ